MKYAVIDISSSSISMIVAAREGEKTEVVFKERASLSLVHYLEEEGLSARGKEKLIEMLVRFKETAAELGVERCYLIATAALRHVKNFGEIAASVFEGTGLTVTSSTARRRPTATMSPTSIIRRANVPSSSISAARALRSATSPSPTSRT